MHEHRMVLAADRFRELRRIWKCKDLSVELKIRIYAADVSAGIWLARQS